MAKSNMYFYKLVFLFVLICLFCSGDTYGQGNCLLYPEDSGERIACELSYRAIAYNQGSKESQFLFDKAIEIGPKYAYAYYQKSVPFFKRGMLAEGVKLINKAIELEPKNYLFYRAYWFFYNRSYELCIKDLEELYTTHQTSFCTTPGGELEMRLLLAMAYAHTGSIRKGIYWIKSLMEKYEKQPHLKGLYDHFCLGVLYYHNKQFDLAAAEFTKQTVLDHNFADAYYYLAMINRQKANESEANQYFNQALSKMKREDGGYSLNIFTEFNTHLEDIESMLSGI